MSKEQVALKTDHALNLFLKLKRNQQTMFLISLGTKIKSETSETDYRWFLTKLIISEICFNRLIFDNA